MTELKPCPFCGGEGYVARRVLPSGNKWYSCGCKRCRVQFGCYKDSEIEAIEQWNKRVNNVNKVDKAREKKQDKWFDYFAEGWFDCE